MYANATIKLERKEISFVVPASAVATNLEKRFVIRLKDGKTEWIDAKNGISMNDKVEIFGNLNIGDTLLVRATDEIKPGIRLIPKPGYNRPQVYTKSIMCNPRIPKED